MKARTKPRSAAWAGGLLLLALVASPADAAAQAGGRPSSNGDALRSRVEAAIAAAEDVPADSIAVSVEGGVVTITGSVLCDGCGGNATPGGSGTVQQSLGAVVRAVPGVERVVFRLRYRPS